MLTVPVTLGPNIASTSHLSQIFLPKEQRWLLVNITLDLFVIKTNIVNKGFFSFQRNEKTTFQNHGFTIKIFAMKWEI